MKYILIFTTLLLIQCSQIKISNASCEDVSLLHWIDNSHLQAGRNLFQMKEYYRLPRKCLVCGINFSIPKSQLKYGKGKYCSNKCSASSRSKPKINKTCECCGKSISVKQSIHDAGHGKFCSKSCGRKTKRREFSQHWKGESVGYYGIHAWIKNNYGKANKCEHCKKTDAKKYEWANKNHKYNRDISEWIQLCTRCHRFFDGQSRGVLKLNSKYEILNEYLSVNHAAESNGLKSAGSLANAIRKGKASIGFYWRYKA